MTGEEYKEICCKGKPISSRYMNKAEPWDIFPRPQYRCIFSNFTSGIPHI